MRVRKVIKRLGLLAVVAIVALGVLPAQAVTGSATKPDGALDVIDYLKHPQNSLRPDSQYPRVYETYQYMCAGQNPTVPDCKFFDIKSSKIETDNIAKTITMSQTINSIKVPVSGDPATAIPPPFQDGSYAFFFTTSAQEKRQSLGFNCGALSSDDPDYNTDDFTASNVGAKIVYSGISPDPRLKCAKALDESKGTPNGTQTEDVVSITDVTTPPHPAGDGWMATVQIGFEAVAHGVTKGTGVGTVDCHGQPTCVDYTMLIGGYEGYGQLSLLQDMRDYDPASQANMSFSIVRNSPVAGQTTITAKVPWNPTIITPDGDGLVDDARSYPWPLASGLQVNKVTNFVAETSATIAAGVNTVPQISAVCPASSNNIVPESQEPIKGAGKTVGDQNRAIYNQTKPVDEQIWNNTKGSDPDDDVTTNPDVNGVKHFAFDDPSQSGEQGFTAFGGTAQDLWYCCGLGTDQGDYTKPDGFWLIGTGGSDPGDCIRGLYGLVTILDWTDGGFQLRLYPRSPSYAPSQSSLSCRYPVGQTPTLVNFQMPQSVAPAVDYNLSPYDDPFEVQVYAGSATPALKQTVTSPTGDVQGHVGPLDGTIGKDQACNYTPVPFGLRYFDILADFTM